jgi:predicted  nucleic acid-binding Zn-ribbon protein
MGMDNENFQKLVLKQMATMMQSITTISSNINNLKDDINGLRGDIVRMETKLDEKTKALFDGYSLNYQKLIVIEKKVDRHDIKKLHLCQPTKLGKVFT